MIVARTQPPFIHSNYKKKEALLLAYSGCGNGNSTSTGALSSFGIAIIIIIIIDTMHASSPDACKTTTSHGYRSSLLSYPWSQAYPETTILGWLRVLAQDL